ncbi:MAG: SPOR domain-containing protein [Bacteroidota bacterium]
MLDRSKKSYTLLGSLFLLNASSCISLTQTQQSAYSEDLAKHRKTFKIATRATPKAVYSRNKQKDIASASLQAVTEQLDYRLECKKLDNQKIKHIAGYTIQVYAGSSREAALKVRSLLSQDNLPLQPEINHNKTNYTVRVGNFLDKKEAYPVYVLIKQRYPKAIIRPISLANIPHIFTDKRMEGSNTPALTSPTTEGYDQDNQE